MEIHDLGSFQPLGNSILVRVLETKNELGKDSLLWAPTDHAYREGVVLRTGPGLTDKKGHTRPLDISPGDQVAFRARTVDHWSKTGERLAFITEGDVLFVRENHES